MTLAEIIDTVEARHQPVAINRATISVTPKHLSRSTARFQAAGATA
jgi:hypothetical protein